MERTACGHRSVASLHKYQRPSEEENMLVYRTFLTMVRREMKALLKIHEPSNGYVWGGNKMQKKQFPQRQAKGVSLRFKTVRCTLIISTCEIFNCDGFGFGYGNVV